MQPQVRALSPVGWEVAPFALLVADATTMPKRNVFEILRGPIYAGVGLDKLLRKAG